MTSRNLNSNWMGILCEQYTKDYEADVPFPVRYLLNHRRWNCDLSYEIHHKITPKELLVSLLAFYKDRRGSMDPTYQNAHIRVYRRQSPLSPTISEGHHEMTREYFPRMEKA